jgi:2-methylisocitrate lyase-like PEP mutase family enzyme
MNQPAALRELLSQPGIIVTPAAYDCLSARLIEGAGFEVVAITGAGVTASTLGMPDLGLITMSELVERVRNIVAAVRVPVIADCETGFGGILNVMRTVSLMEAAGVAGYFLEDQTADRRCGHFANKSVIPIEDMVVKIKAAVRARQNPDLFIMARTDARDVEGLDAALVRARAYAEAGADSLFVESPKTTDELAQIADTLADLHLPLKANMAEGGSTPLLSAQELQTLGYKFAHFPGACQKVAMKATAAFLADLRVNGHIGNYFPARMSTLDERSELLGLARFQALEEELLGRS